MTTRPISTSAARTRPEGHRRGVVAVVARHDKLLVIRRSREVVAPLTYCFPGGGIEPGESEPAALVREIDEELGIAVRPLKGIWRSVTPWQVELSWWLTELAPDAVLRPSAAEVESVHWCTLAEMASLTGLLESNRQFLAAVAAGEIALDV
ncbi:MAG TPA: NUDIX domain-containing protein [Pirellulales bacterium]|jgi:8-oxo-dGTP pyrophosphatase MutT (NUDIX family)|nr:NUDIX domain-containing protein [Pirellulales bacterium]